MDLQITTFYTQIKACLGIDLRDNRGKIHEAALVLVQFVIALLCNRDGNMSRIHEHMEDCYADIVLSLGIKDAPSQSISRAQLPLFLSKIDYELLAFFVLENVTVAIKLKSQVWYALDGKELRGSIIKGSKRGEAIVQIVRHEDRAVVGQTYYNGKKESEIPTARKLLSETGLAQEKVTMDALHLNPESLKPIEEAGGKFLVGLKGNQPELTKLMQEHSYKESALYDRLDEEKGHGREEIRYYLCYDVSNLVFDERWEGVNFQTMVMVLRKQRSAKKRDFMYQESYYLSNIPIKSVQPVGELFDAVRNHWQVEVNNNIRDTVLKEDDFRTYEYRRARTVACCRTLVIRVLGMAHEGNRRKKMDYWSLNFQDCLKDLKAISFL